MSTEQRPANTDKQKPRARMKPGPKGNPAVSQIQKRMAVSKRRAQQLVREAESSEGSAKTLIELKIARQRQIVERGEIELQRLRSNTEETIPVAHLRDAVRCFLHAARVAINMQGERLCMEIGEAWPTHARKFQQFANGSYYASLGRGLYLSDSKFIRAVREILDEGDACFPRGPEAEECARHSALVTAAVVLANHAEGPMGTPAQIESIKALALAYGFPIPEEPK